MLRRVLPASLEWLSLADNKLSTLSGLRPLSALKAIRHLDLSGNPFVSAAVLAAVDFRPLVILCRMLWLPIMYQLVRLRIVGKFDSKWQRDDIVSEWHFTVEGGLQIHRVSALMLHEFTADCLLRRPENV